MSYLHLGRTQLYIYFDYSTHFSSHQLLLKSLCFLTAHQIECDVLANRYFFFTLAQLNYSLLFILLKSRRCTMRSMFQKEKYYLSLEPAEVKIVIQSLNYLCNLLLIQDSDTDSVDELLLKATRA